MNKTLLVFVSFMILFVLVFGYMYNRYNQIGIQLQSLDLSCNDQVYNALLNKDDLYIMALSSDGCKFIPSMTDSLNQAKIKQAMHSVPKLVFYYSDLNCNSCVESIVAEIENFRDSIGIDNIIYISDYKRTRDMQIFKRINQIKSEIFNISSLNIPMDQAHVPFLFVLGKDNEVRSVYVPNKEDLNNLKSYLSIVRNMYFYDGVKKWN